FGDGILKGIRFGSRPGRVLERKNRIVLGLFHQRKGLFEIRLTFARKSHDDICRQSDFALGSLDEIHTSQILIAGVVAFHTPKNRGRTGLNGQMNLVADCRNRLDDLNDLWMKIAGMWGCETDASNSFDGSHSPQQLRKGSNLAGWV